MRLLLSLLLIPSLAFAAVPSAGPNGENAGGLFSVYFQNMTSITCPAGQVITGFSSSPSTYLTPTCQSIISNESWSLSGNTITPGQYIGTNNNQSLIFRTNASSDTSTKMVITTTGAVGIGTDAPSTALDVNGVTRAVSFTDTTNGTWFPWTTTGFNYIRGTTYFSGFLVDEQDANFYINPAQVSVMSGLAISGVITGPTPVAPTQLTTKAYVDAAIENIGGAGGSDKIVVFSSEYQNKNYDESWDICFSLEPLGSWHIPSQTEIEWGARVYQNIFQPSYFYWTSTRVGGDMQLYYKSSTNLPNRSDWLSVANQGAGTRHTLRCVTLRTNTGTTIISTPSTPSIPSVNGSCSTTANTCTAGTAVSYSSGSCGGNATWTCQGSDGGSSASCTRANVACATAACPTSGNLLETTTCYCASVGSRNIWGSSPYTDDSDICGAAQHVGITLPANVTVVPIGSCGAYVGSIRNSISTLTYGGFNGMRFEGYGAQTCGGGGTNGSCGGSANTCNAGSPSGYSAGSCGGSATWTCNGSGGGSSVSCSIANAACSIDCPAKSDSHTCELNGIGGQQILATLPQGTNNSTHIPNFGSSYSVVRLTDVSHTCRNGTWVFNGTSNSYCGLKTICSSTTGVLRCSVNGVPGNDVTASFPQGTFGDQITTPTFPGYRIDRLSLRFVCKSNGWELQSSPPPGCWLLR